MSVYDSYETVIGLEIHAQLKTASKIFCGCSTAFGGEPNSQVCPVCLGMPGVLPVLNRMVVESAVMLGHATNCAVRTDSYFARKNYFYPDLPKGYQVSQYELPICEQGFLMIPMKDGSEKRIGITRIHMEEDAGKLIHEGRSSHVDLNRTGVPLLEIVSEPDMRSSDEAIAYMKELRQILLYLDICDGNMEEGSFRCDANVSVRKRGAEKFGTRAELKNINSFRFVQRAIEYEVERQIDLIESGGTVVQETRLFDSAKGVTFSMRSKEEAHDYRYFPEPDLMTVALDEAYIAGIRTRLPELPYDKKKRFVEAYGLPAYDAAILAGDRETALFFEDCVKLYDKPKAVSNFVMTELLKELNERKVPVGGTKLTPAHVAAMFGLLDSSRTNNNGLKAMLAPMMDTGRMPDELMRELGLEQVNDESALVAVIDGVLRANPKEVGEYLGGKEKLLGFFVGQVMREMKGKANPGALNELMKKRLAAQGESGVDNT